jgi:hypothetical protein
VSLEESFDGIFIVLEIKYFMNFFDIEEYC